MFNVGPLELIVVLIIALIVLGPQRLPDVARSVGRGMREFRSAIEGPDDDEDDHDYMNDPDSEPETEAEAAATATGEGYQKDADSSESSSSSSERV
ncbi:MAG: twin-arginine translocase TatA/TatE family subunit [Thermoleophilaceae bacterium]